MNKKIKNILLLTAFIISPMSIYAQSTGNVTFSTGEAQHNNAHVLSGAQQLYNEWQSTRNANLDPFKRVAGGYGTEYETQKSTLTSTLLSDSYSESVIAINDFILSDIELRKSNRNEGFSSAYDLSKVDDVVDVSIYNTEIQNFRDERLTDSQLHYENLKQLIANHSVTASTSIQTINADNGQRTFDATRNLLQLMNDDVNANKNALIDVFTDNIERAGATTTLSAETAIIANTFSSECPACTTTPLTPVTPVSPPSPPPVVTDPPVYQPPRDPCFDWSMQAQWDRLYYQCR